MTVDLKKYFEGQSDTVEYALDLSGLELDGVKPFCAPIKVQAGFRGLTGAAQLTLHLLYTVVMPCDRCGEETEREWEKEFSHILVRELQNDQEDDEEYILVPDERLDLDELIREDILLDMPSKFLCSPDCKGLCPTCGKNLNDGPCGCESDDIDPRLAILKSLL